MPILSAVTLFATILDQLGQIFFAWGWIFVFLLVLWVAWEAYKVLKMIDYVSAIEWSFLQVTLPDDSEQTPKAMEYIYEVLSGIHKGPDLIEKYFEGYLEAWYSCEIQCQRGRARYIMVVPTAHRRFFEGVIYGQYPTASIQEVEDYSQNFQWQDIGKKFDIYGSEVILAKEDIYPIRTYIEYEDRLAPEDRFIDPHQALIESYTNVQEGEEYWLQILVRPIDAEDIDTWAAEGEKEINKIATREKEEAEGLLSSVSSFFLKIPGELIHAFFTGPIEIEEEKKEQQARYVFTPAESARMEGIQHKIAKQGYKTKIRVIYIALAGELHKPNISRAIGALKQFNTFNLNSLLPDPETKTNGPNYVLKKTRRRFRQRSVLVKYQWRDFWGYRAGLMMNAEELATLYHFPTKFTPAPSVERAKAGLQSAPENLPYV